MTARHHHYPDKATRNLISASATLAVVMITLDGTIANVALPHMQASVSASQDQIVWVITSYLVATAIVTPLSGWLADRFGRKKVILFSIAGFTLASVACGLAMNLEELVLFRLVQGACGAGLVPLVQATLLDINPPERHGQAMALFGMGSMLGPIVGPTLGGYITDMLDWRWIFFINVPVGIVAIVGLSVSMTESKADNLPRFDFMGFACLSIFIGALQLVLDRGQGEDWFDSTEIWIEATVAALFLYFTAVHLWSARHPFVRLSVFRDRNFSTGIALGVVLGLLMYGVSVLLAPMLQQLLGYPVMLAGLVTMPRGIGTALGMYAVGRLIVRIDPRVMIVCGLIVSAISLYMFASFSLLMDDSLIVVGGFVMGVGTGLIFVPMSTIMFSTLEPRYRNEASALSALSRTMGGAIGISYLQTLTLRNQATVHSRLVETVRPDNPVLDMQMPDFDFTAPAEVARMAGEVTRQAAMVAYVDSFWFLFVVTLAILPVVFFMRPRKRVPGDILPVVMD